MGWYKNFLLQKCLGVVLVCSFASAEAPLRPQDNFYQWVNQAWLDATPIPSDKPNINNFVQIQNSVNADIDRVVRAVVLKTDKSFDEKLLATLYRSYVDMPARNALGLRPLHVELEAIDKARSYEEIATLFSRFQMIGVPSPLLFVVMTDFKQSDRNVVFAVQAGLGIERETYLLEDVRSLKNQAMYETFVQELLTYAGSKNATQEARSVVHLEQKLARIQWSNVENRDRIKTSNIVEYESFEKKHKNLFIRQQMQTLGMPTLYPFNIMEPSYVEALNDFFKTQSLLAWKAYLKVRLLHTYAPLLDARAKAILVNYEVKQGLYEKEQPLDKQAIGYLNHSVGMLLGKMYIENAFDEKIKPKLQEIIGAIIKEYRLAIGASTRMEPSTKQKALEKLDAMRFQIGYPDRWQDYHALVLEEAQCVENHKRIQRYDHARNLAKLGKPIDNNDWDHAPQEVNAFYDPTKNAFVILAGILHPPFFTIDGTDAEHYGSMGFVIGHEIGHGFDDQGRVFDSKGNLANWWSKKDVVAFEGIKKSLIHAANRYEILPGKYLKGSFEIGEIIGDESGAEIALRVYSRIVEAKGLERKSAYQAFFKQLAITWRDKVRDEFKILLIDADPHPPSEFRTNGIVKNFDLFHEVFETQKGDKMYLEPQKRVKMW
jgi:putative endopeptidase